MLYLLPQLYHDRILLWGPNERQGNSKFGLDSSFQSGGSVWVRLVCAA